MTGYAGDGERNDMDIEKIRAARQEMEAEIRAAVISAMDAFHATTGMCPERIDVSLVEVTQIAERERRCLVGEVRCTIPL